MNLKREPQITTEVYHPIFPNDTIRVTLVERRNMPGALGVYVRGAPFACPLPEGYDGFTQVHMMKNGQVIAWHPKLPTLVCDPSTGKTALADIPPELYFKDRRR